MTTATIILVLATSLSFTFLCFKIAEVMELKKQLDFETERTKFTHDVLNDKMTSSEYRRLMAEVYQRIDDAEEKRKQGL